MNRLFYVAVMLCLLGISNALVAQQNASSDFHSWTKQDVDKILIDSPWSRTINWSAQPSQTQQIGLLVLPVVPAKIVLRSALPVRQAMLRSRQLDANYDKMNAADKQAFDAKNRALIDCPACADYYVVSISSSYLSMDDQRYLRERMKYVYLSNEAGER